MNHVHVENRILPHQLSQFLRISVKDSSQHDCLLKDEKRKERIRVVG